MHEVWKYVNEGYYICTREKKTPGYGHEAHNTTCYSGSVLMSAENGCIMSSENYYKHGFERIYKKIFQVENDIVFTSPLVLPAKTHLSFLHNLSAVFS